MTDHTCADAKELLPSLVRGDLSTQERARIEAHVSTCASCSEEAALVRQLRTTRPVPPVGLADEIKQAVARDKARPRRSFGWTLPAAATIVLALGTAVIWQRAETLPEASKLAQDSFVMVWSGDDAMVADAPMLEDLSDEELAALLEELGG